MAKSVAKQRELSNHQVVTLAVYLLGGSTHYVDTEDVAIKVNEMAPGRFTWRKYREQINIENVRTFLSDAKKIKCGRFLAGSGKEGWLLTEAGKEFALEHLKELRMLGGSRVRLSSKERVWFKKERIRLLMSEAFKKLRASGTDSVSRTEASAFFRLDEYSSAKAREAKVLRLIHILGDDPELGPAVKELASIVRRGMR